MSQVAAYSNVAANQQETLLHEHLPLVKRITYHLMGRLPPHIEADDLIQAGMIGLMEAVNHYSPGHGASFATYASIRIRGAVMDELRRQNWLPRSIQQKSRELAEAIRRLEARLQRPASGQEIAGHMGLSTGQYHELLMLASAGQLTPLDEEVEEGQLPEDGDANPLHSLQDAGLRQALVAAIEQLPGREKIMMSLYYEEEMNLREIGLVMGVSESRVCQLHGQAISRLRAKLQHWRDSR